MEKRKTRAKRHSLVAIDERLMAAKVKETGCRNINRIGERGNTSQGVAANRSNGHLPASLQGTPLRAKGPPILDLTPPPGVGEARQRKNRDLTAKLNTAHAAQHPGHDELAARMDDYELAFRMQMQVPETLDLSSRPSGAVRRS